MTLAVPQKLWLLIVVFESMCDGFLERVNKMHIRTNETGGVVDTLSEGMGCFIF